MVLVAIGHLDVLPRLFQTIPGPDPGETAAIALAEEVRAGRLIIDEHRGRKIAAERGLRIVGTAGVLELTAEMGHMDLKEATERIKRTDFWISRTLLDEHLALFLRRSSAPGAYSHGSFQAPAADPWAEIR